MKAAFFVYALLFQALLSRACDNHYFRNGKVSTSVCYEDNRFGKACAYNRQGKLIYEKHIRKIAGHASVHFSWYASGAVQKAEFSDAPDGGIQWYRSTTWFSETGEITGQTEDSWNNKPALLAPEKRLPPAETVKCAPIFSSEYWFINLSATDVYVHADRKGTITESHTVNLKPGDTAKGGYMVQAAWFDRPDKYFIFTVVAANGGKHTVNYNGERQTAESVKRFYYCIK